MAVLQHTLAAHEYLFAIKKAIEKVIY